jgi:modulator of FtsH protease HflK
MSWNKPGGDDDKDPWSGRDNQEMPPDLDEAIRTLQKKLNSIFGGDDGNGNGSDSGENQRNSSSKGLSFLVAGAVLLWAASGFYIVDEGNYGVETLFGKHIDTTQSGLHWHLPSPIEHVEIVNVKKQRFIEVGYRSSGERRSSDGGVPEEALMLTEDENIIDVRLAVQYQVKNAQQYLFNLANPEGTLIQVTESAQRGVIGSSKMDFVLTEGRAQIVSQIRQEIQSVMDGYESGIQITSVNLQDAQPPEQVQAAFEDAIKAREDKQRLINEAEAYRKDIVPKAGGAAARKIQEAEGYKQQMIAQAEGEVSRFSQLLTEYSKAPELTRNRLYLETLESVLSQSNTVVLDVKSNNMVYLPLDKIIQNKNAADKAAEHEAAAAPTATHTADKKLLEPNLRMQPSRGREERGRE